MSFLGFGKETPKEVSEIIADSARTIKFKTEKVIQCETRARKENNYQLPQDVQKECLDNLDKIEHLVNGAIKKAKDRLKHSFV